MKPATITTIASMRRYGTHWKLTLSCGCSREVTLAEINSEQLYIGKRVPCVEKNHEKEIA